MQNPVCRAMGLFGQHLFSWAARWVLCTSTLLSMPHPQLYFSEISAIRQLHTPHTDLYLSSSCLSFANYPILDPTHDLAKYILLHKSMWILLWKISKCFQVWVLQDVQLVSQHRVPDKLWYHLLTLLLLSWMQALPSHIIHREQRSEKVNTV